MVAVPTAALLNRWASLVGLQHTSKAMNQLLEAAGSPLRARAYEKDWPYVKWLWWNTPQGPTRFDKPFYFPSQYRKRVYDGL